MENIIPIITHKAMLKIALNQILNQSSSRGREAEIKEDYRRDDGFTIG